MYVEFMDNGTVKILMKEYISECVEAFGEQIDEKTNTPGKHNLFEIKEASPPLTEDKMKTFHHIAAKLLYVSKRTKMDIDLVRIYVPGYHVVMMMIRKQGEGCYTIYI